ncbi:MAG: restriction endonuclease subunit S [Chloroflexota bacterium]|nr:restriction endonuclease subunit S [Chloroflexota bacterium]
MIDLAPAHLEEIQRILAEHVPDHEVRAFGSRATWTAKDYSDLDLAVVGTASVGASLLSRLRESFEESTLPIRVDVVDWASLSDGFRKAVDDDCVVLQEAESPAGWHDTTLGEVLELKRGYDLPKRDRASGSVPLVSSSGITDTHSEAKVPGPGVVTGRYGTLGEVFYIEDDFWPLNTTLYVSDFKGNDPRFISYFLKSLDFFAYSDKAAVPGVNRNHLHTAPVRIPPLDEQRRIAHILGTLDDKIELNQRMSETLEAMAQALFKSWFVDFDPVRAKAEGRPIGLPPDLDPLFPDSFRDSELGEIPEDWDVGGLGDYFDLTMGQSPPGSTYNEDGEGLPFFQGSTDFGFRYPTYRKFCTEPKRIANAGDTLVSVRAPVGDINMASEKCCIGRGLAALRHKARSSSYTYHAARALRERLKSYNDTGTVFGAINKGQFGTLPVVEPPAALVGAFNRSFDDKIAAMAAESDATTRVRDTLLPYLITKDDRDSDAA